MLKEYLAILFSCYLLSNIFLIPVFFVSLSGVLRLASIDRQLRIHKCTVIFLLLCPVFIYVYSVPLQAGGVNAYYDADTQSKLGVGAENMHTAKFKERSITPLPISHLLLPGHAKSIVLDTLYFVIEYVLLITLFGFVYFFFRLFTQLFFLRQVERHCSRRKSFKKIDIIFSSKISLPFSVRLFKPTVYLPNTLSSMEEQIVLTHELNHFRKNHHVWTMLESLLNYMFWYNPISFFLKVKGTLLREMECDADTLKRTDKYVYSHLLIKLAESQIFKGGCFLITQNLISRHTLKKRIEHMLDQQISKKSIGISILIVFALIVTASGIYFYGSINDQKIQSEILGRINTRYADTMAKRAEVEIEKVPQHFIDALLVNEDRDFFKHKGIKLYNIVKASIFNLFHDRQRWLGASTITQQLAKHFLNEPPKKTLGRKFRELKIAKVLEKNFTKVDILEMYLNSVYFGNNAWGLNQAAQTYFGHSYETLTLEESALIVPSLGAPTKYNAIENPILAQARKERLLKSMVKLGVIRQTPGL